MRKSTRGVIMQLQWTQMVYRRNAFFEEHDKLYADDAWHLIIPYGDHTFSTRSIAFAVTSRSGCLTEFLLASAHDSYPVKAFRMIRHPEARMDAFNACPSSLGSWVSDLKERFPTLEGAEFESYMHAEAMAKRMNQAPVECHHASLRRLRDIASVQVCPMTVETLASHWTCQQVRLKETNAITGGGPSTLALKPAGRQPANSKVVKKGVRKQNCGTQKEEWISKAGKFAQRCGGGGAWRLFVSKASSGGKGLQNMTQLSILYRACSPAEKAELRRHGKHATKLYREGFFPS